MYITTAKTGEPIKLWLIAHVHKRRPPFPKHLRKMRTWTMAAPLQEATTKGSLPKRGNKAPMTATRMPMTIITIRGRYVASTAILGITTIPTIPTILTTRSAHPLGAITITVLGGMILIITMVLAMLGPRTGERLAMLSTHSNTILTSLGMEMVGL